MKTIGNVVLLLAFVITVLVAIGVAIRIHYDEHGQGTIAVSDFAFSWVVRVCGAFIAGLAALLMLGRAISNSPLMELFALIPPFLAGLLLIQVHWSVALSLGAIGLALAVRVVVQAYRGQEATDA